MLFGRDHNQPHWVVSTTDLDGRLEAFVEHGRVVILVAESRPCPGNKSLLTDRTPHRQGPLMVLRLGCNGWPLLRLPDGVAPIPFFNAC